MNEKEILCEGQNLLKIKDLSQMRNSFEKWKDKINQNQEIKNLFLREGILLHVVNNPYGAEELELHKYVEMIERGIDLLLSFEQKGDDNEILLRILKNFELFLVGFFRGKPHGKSTIDMALINSFQIKNEYDLQFIMYQYLKPIYPMCRAEVPEDTGYEYVRADICIDKQTVIETKCSRSSMSEKKLIEEIEADIVHYSVSEIFFYIYDKEKIIENPVLFIKTYENKISEKKIHIIILQPKVLI